MPITKKEYELLEAVVAFGGVVTRGMVQLCRPSVSERWAQIMLSNLTEKKYIKHIAGFSSTSQKIFQVTYKACKEFGVPQSHMRKKLSPEVLRRSLLRSHFLFKVTDVQRYGIVSNSGKRIKYLNSLGVDNDLIPRKINKGVVTLQVEEPFLIQSLLAPDGGICVVLIDRIESDTLRQLQMAADRYVPIIRSRLVPLVFLSVAETQDRADMYSVLYEKHLLRKDVFRPKLVPYSINYSYDFCSDTL